MPVTTEQAKVFRGGGRRWFTPRAACRAEARAAIKQRCECSKGDHETPGETCFYHDPIRYQKIVRRLARMAIKSLESVVSNIQRTEKTN